MHTETPFLINRKGGIKYVQKQAGVDPCAVQRQRELDALRPLCALNRNSGPTGGLRDSSEIR